MHPLSHVQVNDDAPQSEPAGQGQLASAQQARRLGPPWPTDSPIPRRERRTRVWCTRTVIAGQPPSCQARCMLTILRCLCLRHSSLPAQSSAVAMRIVSAHMYRAYIL